MIPDFEKMNERMEQGYLNELAPDFDKEQEWQKLHSKLHPLKRRIPVWSYAAAVVVLLAVGGAWFGLVTGKEEEHVVVEQLSADKPKVNEPIVVAMDTAVNTHSTIAQNDKQGNETIADGNKRVATKSRKPNHKTYALAKNYITKDIICNGTPCPIQICISQTVRCPNVQPANISSCSILEPDESGKLSYKTHDKIAKNCSLTINEIEIKSIATGETILLTENSTPSTAQDVFSYITGQRKGDILAGMFNSDCNHKTQKHDLRLDNSYGSLIIQ